MSKLNGIEILNNGNPIELGSANGSLFTVSPSTAKKNRGYYTDKPVPLTKYELKMPGVVVAQNRGMIFSSCRNITGNYVIPKLSEMNIIVVDEVSRTLYPVDDAENKIAWVGNGEHIIKDVVADGQGQHWFCKSDGSLADDLWLKIAQFGYGTKGMLQCGLATDIGAKVVDHWGIERTITKGNTLLLNSSLVKGLAAYDSLEEFVAHGEEWGLTTMQKQWQSGDHKPERRRIIGTQPNATNLALTREEISELIKPEARGIWAFKFEKVAWMHLANINTSRGRAIAARPELIHNNLIMNQIDTQASNTFLRIARGQVKVEAQYLKMYQDKLALSYVYVHGMTPNEAAKKAAETGLHGEIRVNPSFAGRYTVKDENGKTRTEYKKQTYLDAKGRYIIVAVVRYPHGAPSETIVIKAYLDATVPEDVIVFPLPVANDDGTIPVKYLYAMRLQGADFDGDAVTAFTEETWVEAQKRNAGKSYMVIPVNTESTDKDRTLVTNETWETFCQMKVQSLSNQVGLIATSLKYYLSQKADMLRKGENAEEAAKIIVAHACAMGDDIDEFKHGKAKNQLRTFVIPGKNGKDEVLSSPYFVRYSKKFKTEEDFKKAVYTKDGYEKRAGNGVLDMYAVETEKLMNKCGLPVKAEVAKASDGKDRFFFAVHPVKWEAKEVDLFAAEHGEAQMMVALPAELEKIYNIEHGTKFTAKSLFLMLYRDHSAVCRMLTDGKDSEEDRDATIRALERINERYAIAKIAIVAWTKAMRFAKTGEHLDAEAAIKLFTTIMTQHAHNTRSYIDVLTKTGSFIDENGDKHEKTIFSAQRMYNYFLDVCGDGLLLQKEESPNFPEVSETIIKAAQVEMPDMNKAKQKALKELVLIDNLVETMDLEHIDEIADDDIEDLLLGGCTWYGDDFDEYDC